MVTTDTESATGVLPFGWEPGPGTAEPDDGEVLFRFPAAGDPAPRTRRLLIMTLYASALGLIGVGVGVRGLVSVIGGGVPVWYVQTLAGLGLLSVALVVAAVLSIHRRRLPWLLLAAAAVPVTADVLLAVAY
jgi:hypothetical protein